jgi:signal transduction histidine kinase
MIAASAHSAPRSLPHTRSIRGVILAALIAGASAFAVSTCYTTRSAEDAERALPSLIGREMSVVAHATVLSSDLQQVEQLLSEATEGHPWEPGAMRHVLATVDSETTIARTAYARDGQHPAIAFDAVARARSGIEGIRALLDEGRVEDARKTMHSSLRPQLQSADSALSDLLHASFAEITSAAAAQEELRRRSMREALGVDALCALLALAFGLLAYRGVRKQRQALHAQLAELELFADRVAHDILGPLTPVSFALHEASRGATEPLRGFLDRGKRSLKLVTQIVNGLHAFARSYAEPNPSAHAEARPVIENVIAEAMHDADSADVQLEIGMMSDVIVACDEGVLASIVSNLVRNGIRYMGARTVRRVTVHVRADGGRVRVVVEDTGPGLPPGFADRAFLPYSRPLEEKRSGLGLGLATVKRLAERVGGSVRVESTAKGCTFVVVLPIWHVAISTSHEGLRA